MAKRPEKSPAKRSEKSRNQARERTTTGVTQASTAPRRGLQVAGAMLCAVSGWLFLAVVLGVMHPDDHPLGPYLGRAVAERSVWLFGIVPVLLLPSALLLSGLRLIVGAHPRFGRAVSGAWILWAHVLLLFSLPVLVSNDPSVEFISRRGGAFGQFLVESALLPLFGRHWLGPALILGATLLLSCLYVCGVTLRRFVAILAAAAESVAAWLRKRRTSRPRAVEPVRSERRPDLEAVAEKELLAGGALALGVEPRGRFMERRVRPEPDEGVLPLERDVPTPRPRAGRTPLVPGAVLAGAAQAAATENAAELDGKALEVYRNLSEWRPRI